LRTTPWSEATGAACLAAAHAVDGLEGLFKVVGAGRGGHRIASDDIDELPPLGAAPWALLRGYLDPVSSPEAVVLHQRAST
jgi:hypothetical protein